jgi:hypothetical protein
MRRRDISRILFASAAGSMASSARAAETHDGRDYSQTPAEKAAGLTIADGLYEPGCVDRYGVNAEPGKTSMVQAFNAAIKQAQAGGAHVTYGSTAPYLLDAPVDCTFAGKANQRGVVIRNLGPTGFGWNDFGILVKHRGVAAFDCTGTNVEFHRVVIGTDQAVYPQTGVLWARNSTRGSLFCRMQYCTIVGKFSVAPFYNYGAEDDALIDCHFTNYATTPGTKVAVWTGNNIAGLQSIVPGVMATGPLSTINHNCFGNQYYNAAGTSTSDCIYLEQADSWKNFGGWACSASSTAGGRALIYVDMTHAATNLALIEGLTGENTTHLPAHGICFSEHPGMPTGWKVDSFRIPNAVSAIEAPAQTTLNNFYITNISELVNHGLSVAGTLQNSIVHSPSTIIRVGNSKNNSLIGHP